MCEQIPALLSPLFAEEWKTWDLFCMFKHMRLSILWWLLALRLQSVG